MQWLIVCALSFTSLVVTNARAAELERAAPRSPQVAPASRAAAQPRVQPRAEASVASDACSGILRNGQYVPLNYVSGEVLKRFSEGTPLLFTELYFRAVGMALREVDPETFGGAVNAKGVFQERVSPKVKQDVLNVVKGTASANIQKQGHIATAIWNVFVQAFRLDEDELREAEVAGSASRAYYANRDEYLATREFFKSNIQYKREVIELIRLSLPFGVQMAFDNVGRSEARAVFVTAAATASTGIVAFLIAKTMAMLSIPNPGWGPAIFSMLVAPVAGAFTYFYTAPKNHMRKLHIWYMNRANRQNLKKRGLIDAKDGESSIFIREGFRDLTDLRNEVNVADIRNVLPIPPPSAKASEVESSMSTYGVKLGQQMTSVSAFQDLVSQELAKHTTNMGQPISTLARLLQLNGTQTRYEVPEGARRAIEIYQGQVASAFEQYSEIEEEFTALEQQYEIHYQVLEGWLQSMRSQLDTRTAQKVEQKLSDLRNGIVTVKTLRAVAQTQRETMSGDGRALEKALLAIAAVQGNASLDATALAQAIGQLTQRVEQASANEIKESDRIPTTEAGEKK